MKCGNCKESHDTVAQVRLCYHRNPGTGRDPRPKLVVATPQLAKAWSDEDNAAWAEWKNEAARREDEQERAVYEAELRRDELIHCDWGDDGRDALS